MAKTCSGLPHENSLAGRRLALLAIGGIVLYIVLDALLFYLRPDVSLLHNPESDYGNGPWAWIMDANFLLRCLLSLAAVGAFWYALPRSGSLRLALGLLTAWALASGALAFFPDDPVGAPPTNHGLFHLVAAILSFLAVLLATLLLTVALSRLWHERLAVALLTAIWLVAALSLLLLVFGGFKPESLGGLYERLFLGFELLWIATVMWRLRSRFRATEEFAA